MSSLIEWPSLYGTNYFLPGVVVVVLLLALLLLMSSRRRAAAETARNAAEPFDEAEGLPPAPAAEGAQAEAAAAEADGARALAPVTQPVTARAVVPAPSPVIAAGSVASAPATLPVTAVAAAGQAAAPIPDLGQLASGRDIRVTVRTQGPVSGVVGNDPLNAALLAILGGWGDLSPEDRKRLELFRPERLAAAIAAVQLPKSKSGEAKARLGQLRQYSADLERKSLATDAAAAAAGQPAAPPVPEAATAPVISILATPVVAATVAAAPAGDRAAVAAVPSVGATAGLAAAVALGATQRTAPESSVGFSAETGPGTGAAFAGAAAVTRRSDIDEQLASFWAEPRPLWETDTEVSFQELSASNYQEVEVGREIIPEVPFEVRPNGNGGRAEQKVVYPPLTAVPAADGAETSAPRTSAPLTSVDTFFWNDPPADALSRLSVKVETAEQLLALPRQEQADMAAFLKPAELAATFRATEDPELKKAVIDTLEHIGNPASLNALGNCFEDNDCGIQLYALEAADRLLGVA